MDVRASAPDGSDRICTCSVVPRVTVAQPDANSAKQRLLAQPAVPRYASQGETRVPRPAIPLAARKTAWIRRMKKRRASPLAQPRLTNRQSKNWCGRELCQYQSAATTYVKVRAIWYR